MYFFGRAIDAKADHHFVIRIQRFSCFLSSCVIEAKTNLGRRSGYSIRFRRTTPAGVVHLIKSKRKSLTKFSFIEEHL